jgi:Na+/melibiose symporter-like transporter
MTFLDGNDLFTWRKGLWAAMWGGALLWFSIVILHPALSTYSEESGHHIFFFVLLFSSLMLIALMTWGYFRVRDAREARAAETGAH